MYVATTSYDPCIKGLLYIDDGRFCYRGTVLRPCNTAESSEYRLYKCLAIEAKLLYSLTAVAISSQRRPGYYY